MKKKTQLVGEKNSIAVNENDKGSSRSHRADSSKRELIFHYEDMVWVFPSDIEGRRLRYISFKKANPTMVNYIKVFALKQLRMGNKIACIDISVSILSRITSKLISQYGNLSEIPSLDIINFIVEQQRNKRRVLTDLSLFGELMRSMKEDGVCFCADERDLYEKICETEKRCSLTHQSLLNQ